MCKKKAIVVISFGTSYNTAIGAIESIENKIKSYYQEYDFYRAFTSNFIIKKLKERDNVLIQTPKEVFEQLKQEGYSTVVCQSLHVINGIEYEMVEEVVHEYEQEFDELVLGKPLLTTEEDYKKTAIAVNDAIQRENDEALLLMGHGTEHFSNSSYSMLENMFEYLNIHNVFIATVEGFPELDFAITRLKKRGIKKVVIAPLMIVAGDHATNDMAGDEEDAWLSQLNANGFDVRVHLKGLGEIDAIGEIFYEHTKA